MAAGKYSFVIEQGSTVNFEIQYKDSASDPVDFLYNSIGNDAIVPAMRLRQRATDGTLIASVLPTGVNAVGM